MNESTKILVAIIIIVFFFTLILLYQNGQLPCWVYDTNSPSMNATSSITPMRCFK